MRALPELAALPGRPRLPMADRSAALVAELLLDRRRGELAEAVGEQLAEDPPLVLWTVCRAAEVAPDWVPSSVTAVARWLAEHALRLLQWPERGEPSAGCVVSSVEQCESLVAADLARADLASLLAETAGQSAAEEAYLRGLLASAPQWLRPRGDPSVREMLPRWLIEEGHSPAAARVAKAEHLLARGDAAEYDLEGCRGRAAEASARWMEDVPGAGALLPQLARSLARLSDLEQRFAEVLERAKLDAMAELAAGAGHEINNPLAVIGGRAQLFLRDEADPERRRGLALMVAQVKRAYEMIADMRLFARPPQPATERFDLAAMVEDLVAELAPAAAHHAIRITRTGAAGPVEIQADPVQIQVALRAIVQNAQEAIGREGRVELRVDAVEDAVRVSIQDDGPGIGIEERSHLFDPFYSARQAGRGLGLGLSKAWRIVVTNHDGRIEVESEPGQGATFTIVLPLRRRAREERRPDARTPGTREE